MTTALSIPCHRNSTSVACSFVTAIVEILNTASFRPQRTPLEERLSQFVTFFSGINFQASPFLNLMGRISLENPQECLGGTDCYGHGVDETQFADLRTVTPNDF